MLVCVLSLSSPSVPSVATLKSHTSAAMADVPRELAPLPAPKPASSGSPLTVSNLRKKFTWAKLKQRIQQDPVVFVFLGLTVVALTRGMGALLKNDKRQSQRMMRQRVAFQLCTVGALVGGIYYRAYRSLENPDAMKPSGVPMVDNRVFMTNPRNYDLSPEEQAEAAASAAAAGLLQAEGAAVPATSELR